ncbi:MAG: RnfABCDGE type electron transport complex subunit D [Bacilli bacterium]|nr:RnfABCDGE type electron transport complex subunit D [Bacilli bacterium]
MDTETIQFIKESAPHLRRKDSLVRMLLDVVIALMPVTVFAFIAWPLGALKNVLISVAVMEIAELVFVLVTHPMPIDLKKHSLIERIKYGLTSYRLSNFLAALVSALIFALILPASTSWYALMIGAAAGITFGKLLFGGTGNNLFNPAAVGMVFAKVCFGSSMYYTAPFAGVGEVIASPTYLAGGQYSILDLFIGNVPGTIGETCKIAILIGLVYLLVRRAADWKVVLTYLLTFALLTLAGGLTVTLPRGGNIPTYGEWVLSHLLSGGFLFGAVFMVTDPVTMPITTPSRVHYAMSAAIAAFFIRHFAALPEGVGYGILIANCLAPLFDYPKWSSEEWKKKDIIIASLLPALSIAIVIWAVFAGGFDL